MAKDFVIKEVQERNKWAGQHGEFQDYALKLEESDTGATVDGWVALTQKPETAAPQAGATIHGRTEVQTRGDKTWLKFKKENPEYAGNNGGGHSAGSPTSLAGSEKTLEYVVEMLEELTGRRNKPDVAPTAEEVDGDTFDLSEIPF